MGKKKKVNLSSEITSKIDSRIQSFIRICYHEVVKIKGVNGKVAKAIKDKYSDFILEKESK